MKLLAADDFFHFGRGESLLAGRADLHQQQEAAGRAGSEQNAVLRPEGRDPAADVGAAVRLCRRRQFRRHGARVLARLPQQEGGS